MRRDGFASVMIYLAAIIIGMGVVSSVLNTTWIENARRGEMLRAQVLWANTKGLAETAELPARYNETLATAIWLDFVRNNVTNMTNMIDFNRDVRRWNTQTRAFARDDMGRMLSVSGIEPDIEAGYRRFMRKVRDNKTEVTWVFPVIGKIPDETLNSGLRIREDALKVFITDSRNSAVYYPEEYLTTRGEMARYYSDSHRDTQDINPMMPFSVM